MASVIKRTGNKPDSDSLTTVEQIKQLKKDVADLNTRVNQLNKTVLTLLMKDTK